MKTKTIYTTLFVICLITFPFSCRQNDCHQQMISLLAQYNEQANVIQNPFAIAKKIPFMDSLLAVPRSTASQIRFCKYLKAQILMEMGKEDDAIHILSALDQQNDLDGMTIKITKELALASLRLGERSNCIVNHASASCILPISGLGIHRDVRGSKEAIVSYEKILKLDPKDLESRWLLNIAYQTLGEYPDRVPKEFLIPGMEGDTSFRIKAFEDVASSLKLDDKSMAGGSIVEDFDNDGYLDIVISSWGLTDPMHYYKNNADGTFSDLSASSNLKSITGGLNIMQTDYNNDGFKDIFVLRGAWKHKFGKEPNSLLKNNGDGTFTDVTTKSGLLSFHPTQTATWNDFDNDGWLDVFIGNESTDQQGDVNPCELYMNNHDGTFREVAAVANCNLQHYVKGVTSGDYDHDGFKDIFISTMDGGRFLLKNTGKSPQGKEIQFDDVTKQAGLKNSGARTFPTWFWDYNNDGWLDIFVCDYTFSHSLAWYAAAEKLGIPEGSPDKMLLYRNNQNGTFTNVASEVGLNKMVFAMGSNFGDIDNDGYLDMYLGSGNPNYESLVPNKLFKNLDGRKFADVTASGRVGHLQKGHGVSFADMDNDGDQDIYIKMGGAYPGDAYQNSFFLNPGQNDNHWICLQLEGTTSNRAAIGTSLKLSIRENGVTRSIYRDVNSGGSFGSSPLRREIGLGTASVIDEIEIKWHGSGKVQVFKNVAADQFLKITEGNAALEKTVLKKLQWVLPEKLCLPVSQNKSKKMNDLSSLSGSLALK